MRVVTYNVNSLSARLPRVLALLEEFSPDVALLQETKSTPGAFPHRELAAAGYLAADHSGGRWAGVAVLGKAEHGVGEIKAGLAGTREGGQARWVEAMVGDLCAVSVYVVNGKSQTAPEYAEKLAFYEAMAARAAELADQPTVIGGDMNVCPTDLDAWDPGALHGGTHVTEPERTGWRRVLDAGYSDTFRDLHPDEPGYSWWDYRGGAFHKGFGLRIDMILASRGMKGSATDSWISREYRKPSYVEGAKASDHAPLFTEFDRELVANEFATDDPLTRIQDREIERGETVTEQLGLF